ncbi:MAG: hypothetical protein F3745_06340 [Nitrospinae bacterium]|nr:hypothetical protein [Nitrospinota bacterium]
MNIQTAHTARKDGRTLDRVMVVGILLHHLEQPVLPVIPIDTVLLVVQVVEQVNLVHFEHVHQGGK